jgi:capsular polysaccharide biosynthesis protein
MALNLISRLRSVCERQAAIPESFSPHAIAVVDAVPVRKTLAKGTGQVYEKCFLFKLRNLNPF